MLVEEKGLHSLKIIMKVEFTTCSVFAFQRHSRSHTDLVMVDESKKCSGILRCELNRLLIVDGG